jgi:hypothetical protein
VCFSSARFFSFDLPSKKGLVAITGTVLRILKTHKPLHPIDIFGKAKALWRGNAILYLEFIFRRYKRDVKEPPS